MAEPIRIIDIAEREAAERQRLEAKEEDLRRRGYDDQADAVKEILDYDSVDPLFHGLRFQLFGNAAFLQDDGLLASQRRRPIGKLEDRERRFIALFGILLRQNQAPPGLDDLNPFDADPAKQAANRADARSKRFVTAVVEADGEYKANHDIYDRILPYLVGAGSNGGVHPMVAFEYATIAKTFIDDGVAPDDIHLGVRTVVALGGGVDSDGTGPLTNDIELPDLEAQSDLEIIRENLVGMQGVHFAATLEDLKVFQVVDKLIEFFLSGMLPVTRGRAGRDLYAYWKKSSTRMTEIERRNLYARAFGVAGGDANVSPNREFADLWLRFVSAVSSYRRQLTVNDLLTTAEPIGVTQEYVRKNGRDLASNLSLHGYGVAYFAADDLSRQINDMIDILSSEDVKGAYGARDMYQVIDQVASLELGGARNSVRYRTMANSGAIIIRWLANRTEVLSSPGRISILDIDSLRNGTSGPPHKPTVNPTDGDLVDACDQWLAVTGTGETQVEQYSQPVEAPNTTSMPIQIPSVARDLLASVGVSAPIVGGTAPMSGAASNGAH